MSGYGGRLRAAREAAGVSLAGLARRTNYSKPYLGQLETGSRAVTADHVKAYEEALGVQIDLSDRRIDAADVELVAQVADAVTAVGLRYGGLQAAEMAAAQWKWASGLLDTAASDGLRVRLHSEAALLADRLAWSLADSGRVERAQRIYSTALRELDTDPDTRNMVRVDLANHFTDHGDPGQALAVLEDLKHPAAVHDFTASGARARAHALLGEVDECRRQVGQADEAWARVDLDDLPACNRAFVSGHEAHVHWEAGKAFYELARAGYAQVNRLAVERLERARELFGPDRARAVSRCEARLGAL